MDASDELGYVAFVMGASPRLLRAAELLAGDAVGAEDLLQTALIKAYRRWPAIHADPYAYVRKAMITTQTDWWRRRSQHERPSSVLPEASVADHAEQVVQRDALALALQVLSPRERAVVVLRYFDDLSVTAAAAVLGVTVGTVKKSTARALEKLRLAYAQPPEGAEATWH